MTAHRDTGVLLIVLFLAAALAVLVGTSITTMSITFPGPNYPVHVPTPVPAGS
jgi:hypothetical protein